MDSVLALSSEKNVRALSRRINRRVTRVRSVDALLKRLAKDQPGLVIVDIALPSLGAKELLKRLTGTLRGVLLVVVDDLATLDPGRLSSILGSPAGTAARVGRRSSRAARLRPQLHDPRTGRIDANRVAGFFGLSHARLAKILARSPQSVHKTPHAESLQDGLSLFLRIATALMALFGSAAKAKVWLNTPHPDLDNKRPVDLIEERKGEVVADLLEDALLGHPG